MSHSNPHMYIPTIIAIRLLMKDWRAELGNDVLLEENDRTVAKPVPKSLHRKFSGPVYHGL